MTPKLTRAPNWLAGAIPSPEAWNAAMDAIEQCLKLKGGAGISVSWTPNGPLVSALSKVGFQPAIIVCTAEDGSNDIAGVPDLYYVSPSIQTNSGSTDLPTYAPDGSSTVYIASLDSQYTLGTPRLPPGAPCIIFPGSDSEGNPTWRIIYADPTPNGQTCDETSSKCLYRWTCTYNCSIGGNSWLGVTRDTGSYPQCGGTVPKTCSWNMVAGSSCVAEYFAFGDSSCVSGSPTVDCTDDSDCTDWPSDPGGPNFVPDTCCPPVPPSGTCGCVFTWFVAPQCPSPSPSGCPNGANWGPIGGPVQECKPSTGLILGMWITNPSVPNGKMWQVTTADTCFVTGTCSPTPCTTAPTGGPTCPPNTNPCPTSPNNCPTCIAVNISGTVYNCNAGSSNSWASSGTTTTIGLNIMGQWVLSGPSAIYTAPGPPTNPCPPMTAGGWTYSSGSNTLNSLAPCSTNCCANCPSDGKTYVQVFTNGVSSCDQVQDGCATPPVTSVGLALPSSVFTTTGSPVTSSGTLTGALATQTANLIWAGPSSGSDASPTFRALVAADLPGGVDGTVTSVDVSVPSFLASSGGPITTSGTIAIALASGVLGVPVIVAKADLTGQTAAGTVTSYANPTLGTFEVGGYVNITAISLDVATYSVAWTDENGASQSQLFSPMGTTAFSLNTTGFTPFNSVTIRVKASTTITILTNLTTSVGSIAFDTGGWIKQLY